MTWNKDALANIPSRANLIFAGDDRIKRYCEDTMMLGFPDAVMVANDEQEIAEVLAFCNAKKIPVTFCGSQTSMTGASVPLEGLLISTEKLEGVIDISKENNIAVATVRPGTVVADFQKAVAEAGYFYPVAPTSRDECRIGANVATNATGEDSFKYGPLRVYVRRLELILPTGDRKILERNLCEIPSWERNRAGYFVAWKNPIDLVIGSEGTLGFISKITFALLPPAKDFFSALIPMPSNDLALKFVIEVALGKRGLKPRALELIDSGALKVMCTAKGFPNLPESAKALLYIKQEYADDDELCNQLELWQAAAIAFAGRELSECILIAETHKQREDFRLWRHHIPEMENERGRQYWTEGGGKVGSDWWVPIERLSEMMSFFYRIADQSALPYIAYAHIGAGHPHTNLLGRNAKEKERAIEALRICCRRAVELGGGVCGEHGVGKIHTDLMPIQHDAKMIEAMKKWKREYDPNWILGIGNIF